MKRLLSFLLLSVSLVAHGANVADFAYGLRIDTPPGGPVYALDLPMPVYVGVTRSDLGDLRVFNGRRQEVPILLRPPKLSEGEAPAPQLVPIFPLYGEAAQEADLTPRAQLDPQGAIVELQSGRTLHNEDPIAYLMDLSAVHTRPMALELQWQMSRKSRGFVAHVNIVASDDLIHWNRVVTDATVAELNQGGNRLERRRIELGAFTGKYLRMEWPEAARDAELNFVRVRFTASASFPSRQWIPLEGKPEIKDPRHFQFFSGGRFPVECARVVPRDTNTAMRFALFSRATNDQAWQPRGEGLVYKLDIDNEELVSEPLCFEPTADAQWRLELVANGSFGQGRPVMELGWAPHRLLFLARGKGPFTLAYGSNRVTPSAEPRFAALDAKHLGASKATISGAPFALGGSTQQDKDLDRPWRLLLLGALLVLCVTGTVWLAFRLRRAAASGGRE